MYQDICSITLNEQQAHRNSVSIASFLGKAIHIVDVTLLSWQAAVADPVLIGVEVLQPLHLLSNACIFLLSS